MCSFEQTFFVFFVFISLLTFFVKRKLAGSWCHFFIFVSSLSDFFSIKITIFFKIQFLD